MHRLLRANGRPFDQNLQAHQSAASGNGGKLEMIYGKMRAESGNAGGK